MSDLRSAKANIELQAPSGKSPMRPRSKVRKAVTVVLATSLGVAIVIWIAVLGWGAFTLCRWALSFLFST